MNYYIILYHDDTSSLSTVISRYTILVQHAESKVDLGLGYSYNFELVCNNLIQKRYLEYFKLIYLVSAVGEKEKAFVAYRSIDDSVERGY